MKPINKYRKYRGKVLSTYDDPDNGTHVVFLDVSEYMDWFSECYPKWGDISFTHDNQILPKNLVDGEVVDVVIDSNMHMISINVHDIPPEPEFVSIGDLKC